MGWDNLASNQTISFTNLADAVALGYFIQKAAIPDSNEQITKADADAKVYLDTSYSPFANKASNQLVVKSNLRPISYAYTIYYEEACYYDGFYIEIEIKKVGTRRAFPLMSYRNDEMIRVFTNDMIGRRIIVDKVSLEDL